MLFPNSDMSTYDMMDWFHFNLMYMWIGIGIYAIISLILAYYVYTDVSKRNIPNSQFWIIIVLIFNVIGLIAYLIFREPPKFQKDIVDNNSSSNEPSEPMIYCPFCGKKIPSNSVYCPNCGSSVQ